MNKYAKTSIQLNLLSVVIGFINNVFEFSSSFLFIEILTLVSGIYSSLIILHLPTTRFNFLLISSAIISLGSSLGILNTFYSVELFTDSSWYSLLLNANVTDNDIIVGQIYINAFCASLTIFGLLLQNTGSVDSVYEKSLLCLKRSKTLIYVVISVLLIELYLIYTGDIVFGGISLGDAQKIANPLMGVTPLFAIMPIWCGYNLISFRLSKLYHLKNIVLILSLTANLYYFFTNGRRMIVFYFILILIGYFFDKPLSYQVIRKNIILIVIGCFISVQISNVYNKLRLIKGYSFVQEQGILSTLQKIDESDNRGFSEANLSNVATRTSYSSISFAYFVTVIEKYDKILYGKILKNSFLNATPSDWFVDKSTVLIQERLYMEEYPINILDISDSIYLESMIDFKYLGVLIYPAFLFIILLILYKCINTNNTNSFLLGASMVLMALSMIETGTTTFITTVRIIIVCFPIVRIGEIIRNTAYSKNPKGSTGYSELSI